MRRTLACILFVVGCRAPASEIPTPPHDSPSPSRSEARSEEIGSLRHARVAIPRGSPPERLTYFARGLDDAQRDQIVRAAPHLDVVVDLSRDEALRRAGEAHGVDA